VSNNNGNGNGNDRISAKQHQYITNLVQTHGWTTQELNEHCVRIYEAHVDFLSRKEASSLIDALRSQKEPGFNINPFNKIKKQLGKAYPKADLNQ
jgi:hypothetical protein